MYKNETWNFILVRLDSQAGCGLAEGKKSHIMFSVGSLSSGPQVATWLRGRRFKKRGNIFSQLSSHDLTSCLVADTDYPAIHLLTANIGREVLEMNSFHIF